MSQFLPIYFGFLSTIQNNPERRSEIRFNRGLSFRQSRSRKIHKKQKSGIRDFDSP
jgi:hypothetical protein